MLNEHNYCIPRVEGSMLVSHPNESHQEKDIPTAPSLRNRSDKDELWTLIKERISSEQHLPAASVDIIINSLKLSTKNQYSTYLMEYIKQEGMQDITATKLIRYLTTLYNRGLGYSAINTARSAVSTLSSMLTKEQVGNDSLVTRFMKGIFQNRPSLPRYTHTWDPDIALKKLDTCHSNLPFIELSRKVAFIVTLLSGQRVATISQLKLKDITINEKEIYITVSGPIKQTKPGMHQKPLHFNLFKEKPNLCPFLLIKEYIKKSHHLRTENCDNLFITTVSPFHNAATSTISKWIRYVLQNCGLEQFGSHSLRGAATSALARCATPIDDIMEAAGWRKRRKRVNFSKIL